MRRTFVLTVLAGVLTASTLSAQEREIRGRVTGAPSGAGLADALVDVVGAQYQAVSDRTGSFVIRAPSGEVRLRVSLLGYTTTEVVVGASQSDVQILMDQDVLNITGVVVTGRATSVQRRNLANAVATVVASDMDRTPAESVEKQIVGRVSGALIETNSGAPGGGIQVRLRGVSTINGASEPLYVVDGVIVSNVGIPSNQNAITAASGGSNPSLSQDAVVNRIADLNPNDIERIEILKGASAAAIYGSKAANGVVVITTKRGRPGETRFNLTQRFGVFDLSNKIGFRAFETVDEAVAAFGEGARGVYSGTGYDYEEILAGRNDLSTETVFDASGGTESTRFYASALLKNDEGIIANTGFEKEAMRLNLTQQVGEGATLSLNSAVTHTLAQRGITNNDNSGTSYYMVFPFTPNFVDLNPDADGIYPANPFERSNPLQTAEMVTNDEDVWRFITSGSLDLRLMSSATSRLDLKATGGVDYFQQVNELFAPPEVQFEPNDGLLGTSLLSNSSNLNVNIGANLVHSYTPTSGSYSAMTSAGVQFEDADLNIARITSQNLIAGQSNVNAGTVVGVNELRNRVRDFGVYAQEELLLLEERLLLSAGIRGDRSSANGDTGAYFVYPKAAASYRFPELSGSIDEMKVRMAWGQSGNRPLFGQKFTPLTAINNIEGIPGVSVGGVTGSADLEPERQSEIEAGVDLTLFGGRATLETTVYQKNISNMILSRTLAPSTGFTSQIFNGGELRVRGLELAAAATPVNTETTTWISRATFFLDRSRVNSIPVPSFRVGGFGTSLGSYEIEEGASVTQIVTNLGLDAGGNVIVGAIGDANPDFKMAFSNEVQWGAFSLFGLLDWQKGGTIVNLTKLLYDFGQNYADHDEPTPDFDMGDGTLISGTTGEVRLGRWLSGDSRGYFEDASYVKLRELSLSYALPASVVESLMGNRVESLQINFSGRNLLTFTDYSGLDPEVSNFGNQAVARNIDVAPFPPSRSFWLSVNVSF